MSLEYKGYAIHDQAKWDQFSVIDFKPKTFGEYDCEIAIEACGVCGSDVHTITGGWGEAMLPLIVGHEVCGRVVKIGAKVTEIKEGQRVGVGAQVWSCMKCKRCQNDNENYCPHMVDTYNAKYPNGDIAQGGYASAMRAHERFVFPVPDSLPSETAAPMMCGGLTVWSPLVRHGAGPGKKVGVVGLGGLGHFAVLFAAAMGAEVTVFSHSSNKKEDALKMGAKHFIMTSDEKWAEQAGGDFDLILSTRDVSEGFPLSQFLSLLDVNCRFITVGMPDKPLPSIMSQDMAGNGALCGGSHIGSKKEALAMLEFAAKHNIRAWTNVMPMKDASKAVRSTHDNSVRYRNVLKCDL